MKSDKQKLVVIVLVIVAALLILWRVFAGVQARKAMKGEDKGSPPLAETGSPQFDKIKQRMEEEK